MGTGWSQDESLRSQEGQVPDARSAAQAPPATTPTPAATTPTPAAMKDGYSASPSQIHVANASNDCKQPMAKDRPIITNTSGTDQAIKIKLPHNFESIIKDSDAPIDKSSPEKLYEQLQTGIFLNGQRKKYWLEKNGNYNSFFILPRDLHITWSEDKRFWHWDSISEPSNNNTSGPISVAELLNVCWLEVCGKFNTTNLSPQVMYQVAYIVMVKDFAYGWEVPVNIRLTLPNGTKQEHKENLNEKPKGKWIQIPAGDFKASPENIGEIEFSMYEYEGGQWKRGLVIRGVTIQPVN